MQSKTLMRPRKISRDEKPNLKVKNGEIFELDLPDFSGGVINQKSTSSDISSVDFNKGYALAGPIYIEGAKRNDVLEIEFLEFKHHGWGYTAIFPEVERPSLDYFPEEIYRPHIVQWEVKGDFATWKKYDIKVPINPFLGAVGTAPSMNGSFDPLPPRDCGGNLDLKHLVAGSKLYLPVNVDGALLLLGDPHVAMGDGEVFSSAIEAPLKVKLRVKVIKDTRFIDPPMCLVTKPSVFDIYGKGYIGFSGVARTIDQATEIACHKAMAYFCSKMGMPPQDAAILLGVVFDLKISEIPDNPNKVVTGMVPLSIFSKGNFP